MVSGEKVRIRALERTDIDNFMEWVNNRDITKYLLAFTVPVSRAFEEKWLEKMIYPSDTDKAFAIETLDGRYLGNIGLHAIDALNRHAELGIVIGKPDFLSQGYGRDAINVLLRMAFHNLNLEKVYLRVFSGNTRGIRCYEQCGFETVGRLKRHRYVEGEWHDEVIMEIFKAQWNEKHEA